MTAPKSRSMRMSEAIRTAKPAIAVRPEASDGGAGAGVGAAQRRGDVGADRALLLEAAGEDHRELGGDRDRQRPERRRHRVERDAGQPDQQRGPAGGEHGRQQRDQRAAEASGAAGAGRGRRRRARRGRASNGSRRARSPLRRRSPAGRRGGPRPPAGGLPTWARTLSISASCSASVCERMPKPISARLPTLPVFGSSGATCRSEYGESAASVASIPDLVTLPSPRVRKSDSAGPAVTSSAASAPGA